VLQQLTGFVRDMGSALMRMVGDFFGGLFEGLDEATGGRISGALQKARDAYTWVQDHIITPVSDFFSNLGTRISTAWDSVKDFVSTTIESITGFFKEYFIWPIRDFFGNIGSFFGAMRGKSFREIVEMMVTGGIGAEQARVQEERIRAIATEARLDPRTTAGASAEELSKVLRERGIYAPSVTSVDDAIITPQGDIVRTSPDDFIYAARSLSAITDQESSTAITAIQQGMARMQQAQIAKMNQMIQALQQNQQGGGNNVVQNNITSRYAPYNIMNTLSATGEL
jgi:hypothetical protein